MRPLWMEKLMRSERMWKGRGKLVEMREKVAKSVELRSRRRQGNLQLEMIGFSFVPCFRSLAIRKAFVCCETKLER